jgi:hypothetical protein
MKRVLAVLTLALFIGGISVPAVAAINNQPVVTTLTEEDPAKKATDTKTEVKSESKTEVKAEAKTEAKAEKKSHDCAAPAEKSAEKKQTAMKAEAKSHDCAAPAEGTQSAKKESN